MHVDLSLSHRPMDLDADKADVTVRYGGEAWERLEARLLFKETLRPVAAQDLALQIGADATAEQLLRYPLLHDSDISHWRSWLAGEGVSYRPRWHDRRFEGYDTVLTAAKAGLGIALLREPLARADLTAGRIAYLSPRSEDNPAAHFVCLRVGEQRMAVRELAARLSVLAGSEGKRSSENVR
ncbi:hypothetical protein LB579_33260 [Mesorhizobium sp. BR1-1-7]|uniref:LysR substrate-binding domain-containing protein n=1 Tax=Mesorhizobium sp. BR1-1-7 TaxID=2876647 RepID=UPI001CCF29C6|nr:LysR substrate-binding domain-containing protein [Mesorhizobium sp. BR1-1-7]MBZ9922531.1 hypothetical protein [Mesorhizobium sp. BR1-1-7]